MSLATHVELVDAKSDEYCAHVASQLVQQIRLKGANK